MDLIRGDSPYTHLIDKLTDLLITGDVSVTNKGCTLTNITQTSEAVTKGFFDGNVKDHLRETLIAALNFVEPKDTHEIAKLDLFLSKLSYQFIQKINTAIYTHQRDLGFSPDVAGTQNLTNHPASDNERENPLPSGTANEDTDKQEMNQQPTDLPREIKVGPRKK